MTLLDSYRSQLRRAEDQLVKDEKKVSDLYSKIVDKETALRATTSATRQRSLSTQIQSLSRQHATAQQSASRQRDKVNDLKKKVQRYEESERTKQEQERKRLDRKIQQDRRTLEQRVAGTAAEVRELHGRVSEVEETLLSSVRNAIAAEYTDRDYDVYLLHAGPDAEVSADLFEALRTAGLSVWFDEDNKVTLGHSLFRQMNAGNARSHAGVVLITEAALEGRYWLESEIGSFLSTQRRLIPVLHKVDRDDLNQYSPFLADLKGLSTADHSFDEIARLIADTLQSAEVDAAAFM